MANAFNKEERVQFDNVCEAFDDALVMSKTVTKLMTNAQDMERQADVVWYPHPYIAQSFDGIDQTANLGKDITQLSVPATLGFHKSVPWSMDAKQLRDALQTKNFAKAARQKLASDINVAITNVASLQGSLVVKRTVAATGFDDVALADSIMTEQGVPGDGRYIALTPRDYNAMAGNLASRQTLADKTKTAYEQAYIGNVSGFEALKMGYPNRLVLAGGGAITVNGANQYYTPKATSTAGTGETSNVDNRFQNLTVSSTAGVKAGDAFTLTGVNAVHHITKQDTGQLKTFRVNAVVSGTVLQITPPIISAGGATDAEKMYQNVTAAPANGTSLTWMNTVTSGMNPFWHESSLGLLPGRLAIDADAGASVMRATLDNGLEVAMMKQFAIGTTKHIYRFDVLFGVVNLNTEMNGILMFNQV